MADETIQLELGLDSDDDLASLARRAAKKLGLSVEELGEIEILKRSIDARRGRVRIHYLVRRRGESEPAIGGSEPIAVSPRPRVVIVGSGPGGLFCAYELARKGVASIVLERGKKVQPRRHDLKGLTKGGTVDADSNYCFGEGGAGTYSDGKLYTRAHKRGDIRDVIEILVHNGAPPRILSDARPHIGSNKLPVVITTIRERLESVGVEFRFQAKVTDLLVKDGRTRGVVLEGGEEIEGDSVVMATGHSARDVYEMLDARGVALEAKGFALGVRIEHPQAVINQIQYGKAAGHPKLPAASYRLVHDAAGRGVFSFCMCPGGWIVPASTDPGALVVNGMSLSKRDSPFANSGMVVSLQPTDWQRHGFEGPLGGIALQHAIEAAAWNAGGGSLAAPAMRVSDFVAGRPSGELPESSYVPGVVPANLAEVLDVTGLEISSYLRTAIRAFAGKMRGYISDDAIVVGVESRTSAPVRVLRDTESLQSPTLAGLYPCGEGAGYAGGIVSAAMDGMRVARSIVGVKH